MKAYDQSYYDSAGYFWDRTGSHYIQGAEHIKKHFAPSKALDVGCALGFMVKALREQGIESCGIDSSEYAVSYANTPFVTLSDASNIPEADRSFDVVISFDLLEHLSDPEPVCSEIRRLSSKWIVINVITSEKPSCDPTHQPLKPRQWWVDMLEDDEWESVDVQPYLSNCWWFNQAETLIVLRRKM